MATLTYIKLIGGPGDGTLLKVVLKSSSWVWQHNGRNYFYTLDGVVADVAPEMGGAENPVPLFFDGVTTIGTEPGSQRQASLWPGEAAGSPPVDL